MNKAGERLYNGIIKENPTLVLMLGMCPTLAVTTSAINGLGMGLTTTVVLALSNAIIALLRKIIPDKVRIPAFIVIIASFVTIVELLLEGFIPSLYSALGLYIPLIVVNCIILGRAESYAYKNPVIPSFFDGVGMGLGFTCSLTIIGLVREIIGAGEAFGFHVMPDSYIPVSIFVMAPGAFFVLAILVAIQNKVKIEGEKKGKDMSKIGSGCSEDCMNCGESGCSARKFYDNSEKEADEEKKSEAEEVKAEEEVNAEKKKETEKKVKNKKKVKAEKEETTETEKAAEEVSADE
ncbi:MAG: electron transport complex subunit E [Lachnospiraceae bacterium]|nr:electron transport complex subunit E [Lachnospiraceae bacterium]